MSFSTYFGIGDYHGLGYYKGYVGAQLPERPYRGEEVRDNEYYASKYFHRFARIVGMIEHGHVKFDSEAEKWQMWEDACSAMSRYKERMHMFNDRKHRT